MEAAITTSLLKERLRRVNLWINCRPSGSRTREIMEEYRSGGGLSPTCQGVKLDQLSAYLQAIQPERILELGTGATTWVLADFQAMTNCQVDCVDENDEFARVHLEGSGISARYFSSDTVAEGLDTAPAIDYSVDIVDDFDLVILDGPNLTIAGKKYRHASSVVPILRLVESGHAPRVIMIDGPTASCEALMQLGRYHWRKSHVGAILPKLPSRFHYWNVLTLR